MQILMLAVVRILDLVGGERVSQQLQQLPPFGGMCCCAPRPCHPQEAGDDGRKPVSTSTTCCKVKIPECPTHWSPFKVSYHIGQAEDCNSQRWKDIEEGIMTTSLGCQGNLWGLFPRLISFSRDVDWTGHHIDSVHTGHWGEDMMYGLLISQKDDSHGMLFTHPADRPILMLWELPTSWSHEWEDYLSVWSRALSAYTDFDTPFSKRVLAGEGLGPHGFDQKECSRGKTMDRLWGTVSTALVASTSMLYPLLTLLWITVQQLTGSFFYKYEVPEIAKKPPKAGWKIYNKQHNETCEGLMGKLREKVELESLAIPKIWKKVPWFICEEWRQKSPPPPEHCIYNGQWFEVPFSDRAVRTPLQIVESAEDCRSPTPLFYAKTEGVAKALLAAGASVNEKNNDGATPLFKAETEGVAKALLAAGASVNEKNVYGNTPLFGGGAETEGVAKALLAAGASVNEKNIGGETPLFNAKNEGVVKALLAAGASVNEKKTEGVAKALLAAGASVNEKTMYGKTPLSYAENEGVRRVLQAAGGK
eukprot:TRINITY_DN9090_c0_g1_i10.p1 TRINITY_DN9090_c0_g1~~TRINITY_DN9090_c0_g1_i10.p1  ORF type:complete len:533 (+),score=83.25 TRINITY_DN9090_c0_g1_i10:72-1670(+)